MATRASNIRLAWEETMPPLAEAFADFKGFAPGELRLNRLYDLLSVLIHSHRRLVARRFYPTRELAEFFGVSVFTMATVFRRLQRKGLLTLMRGSQTMIPARIPRTRITVRGLVAMPIWMPAFLQFVDWRRWLAIIQDALSRHRFAVEPVFFTAEEDTKLGAFVDRMLRFNPDYVLWYFPVSFDLSAMRGLADAGVSLITVDQHDNNFPGRCYPVSRDHAMRKGLKEWEKSGAIDEIILSIGRGAKINEDLKAALKSSSLPHRVKMFGPGTYREYLKALASQPRTGIIFEDHLFYADICNREPGAMLKLFSRRRSLVARHVLIPGGQTKGVKVDVVSYSWPRLAERIALDLSQAKGGVASRQPVFHAEWHPLTPLEHISQSIVVE